jgi:vitamin K-dependent gamma-carboxylase
MTELRKALGSAFDRAESRAFRRVDIIWLAAFRVLFGLTMCVGMLRFIANGWIDLQFVETRFRFKYWGFGWVEVLPPAAMHALFWVLAGLALAVAVGFRFRTASLLFTLGFVYLELIDVTNYLNHYYLAALLSLLLTLSPANRAFSIDALLAPKRRAATVPLLWHDLFRFQVGIVYVFAGLAKAHADWLVHAAPLRIWLSSNTDVPVLGAVLAEPWAPVAMSWAGFLFDSTVVAWLLVRRTRPYAYAAVVVFHVITGILFPIGMFPVIMIVSALVFFDDDWPRRYLRRLPGAPAEPVVSESAPRRTVWQRAALVVVAAYCLVELVLPLRFLAYGGDVRWHEQGMRFSWRVMVREKNGSITFVVRNKTTRRTWHVQPDRYLTRLQERQLSGQPDLILQLAHHIRDDFERRGLGPVEVRVDALVSLNGRRLSPLIDPSVDLATVRDGIGRASWILPAPSEPPPLLRPI